MADIMVNMRFYKSSGVDVEKVAYGRRQQHRLRIDPRVLQRTGYLYRSPRTSRCIIGR